ncbi:MAG: HAMP domain-containing sensor histidine kinase [Candidatus Saccharimonadales bacterium]
MRIAAAAWMILGLYSFVGTYCLVAWSINAPVGILIMAFVIFLSAILLGSSYILRVTIGIITLLISIQLVTTFHIIEPDRSSLAIESGIGDVMSYAIIFGIFALIAWIAGIQVERSLSRAKDAEAKLEKERDLLAVRLEERTKSLREAQIKEMAQLHHFAELGQLTTVILHELANYLSILTLDVDDLKHRHKQSSSVIRVQESISYLDSMIDQVRAQIKESSMPTRFNALKIIKGVNESLSRKIEQSNVVLVVEEKINKNGSYLFGDAIRFSHVLTILVNNAIDSYKNTSDSTAKQIIIRLSTNKNKLKIQVIDFGSGISIDKRKELFKPLQSSKAAGSGMGLYIAKQITETHFKGSIRLSAKSDCTDFIITLPLALTPIKRHNHS